MHRIRFIMIGGFLGAGKTTAISRLARHYMGLNQNVGLVTNDQAYDLVDTQSLRAQGFRVGEVPGACFCCKFNDLVETAGKLSEQELPDMIITEPVGSCTDLVATVIEPLRQLHGQQYDVAPLAVLLKPEHGQKILSNQQGLGFSPKAAYIFLKQIEEADIIAINKIDKLTAGQQDDLMGRVYARFPDKQVIGVSARDGTGFDELIDSLRRPDVSHERLMDVDYDVYAAGEAELGWLNCTVDLHSDGADGFSLDVLAVDFVKRIQKLLDEQNAEPAHLKVLVRDDAGRAAMANLVGSDVEVELSMAAEATARDADLTVNARVAMAPERLEAVVREAVESMANSRRLTASVHSMQRFRPARPVPMHRYVGETWYRNAEGPQRK